MTEAERQAAEETEAAKEAEGKSKAYMLQPPPMLCT